MLVKELLQIFVEEPAAARPPPSPHPPTGPSPPRHHPSAPLLTDGGAGGERGHAWGQPEEEGAEGGGGTLGELTAAPPARPRAPAAELAAPTAADARWRAAVPALAAAPLTTVGSLRLRPMPRLSAATPM